MTESSHRSALALVANASAALALLVAPNSQAQGVAPGAGAVVRPADPSAAPNAGASAAPTDTVATEALPDNGPPRLLQFVQADYPPEARAAGREAAVVLQITVAADGTVSNVTADGEHTEFTDPAIAAARRFTFRPARRDGQSVPAILRFRYRFTLEAQAQPQQPAGPVAVLRGVVRSPQNRPLADAELTLEHEGTPPQTLHTGADGTFRAELTAAGTYVVRVRASGMREFRAEETVNARDDVQLTYRMVAEAPATPTPARPRDPDEDGAITVRAQRPPREVTRTTLDRREIERVPGTGGDALRSIQNLPGMSRPPALLGLLLVRGAAPQDTQVFADGTDLPLLYHFGGLTSVIPTEMLDRIDFYPGNFSARYGRATGGIVDAGLRSPRQRGFRGVANISVLDASVFIEGAITPTLSFAVAGRRSYIDVFLNAILSNVPGVNLTAAPVYYDYQGILEWRPARGHRLRLALFGSDDTLSILFAQPGGSMPVVGGRFSFATRFHLAQVSWVHDIAPGTQQRAMLSAGYTGLDFGAGELGRFDISQVPFNFRYEFSHTLATFARMNTGFDLQWGTNTVQIRTPEFNGQRIAADINTPSFNPAWYAELELTPVRGLRIVPSLRIDWYRAISNTQIQPRMSFRYEFLRDWAVKGGVGVFGQPPQPQESTSAANAFLPGQTLGNPNLRPIRSIHYSLGGEHNFSRYISLSVEGFVKTIDDLVIATPTLQRLQNPTAVPYTNNQIGRVFGAEILLRHRPSDRFFGWVAYTLMRSERRDSPTEPWRLFAYDQTHILTVVANYRLPYGFEIGGRFRYVTGSPNTPVVASYYNADGFTYTNISGPINSVRNADFHQLDVRVDKRFDFRWGSIGLYLEVLNVYNQANVEGVQYNYDARMSTPLTGLPIIPNLGIRGEVQ